MNPFAPIRLHDEHVVLEPLSLDHAPALEAAADGELWNLTVTSVPPPGQARGYVEKALQGQADGLMLPFAVREAGSGEVVGSTRYYEIDAALPRLAIGYTWYARRWQKTHLNTACKRLLLEHAFEALDCVAVAFHADEGNEASLRAIERLGAQREGVLRAHKRRTDGSLRNTVCFSILADEWPHVANWLGMRLDRLAVR
ncbi:MULTISPECIES: GNAT family N-acetyltransferase [Rhodanobacter]|uniref:GNAT family N-acetyltransferase n=1 Tax=Rhodanobacter TaxID=75309 RepID=UPI000411C67E|nr:MULTISPECIES: GNAT family protein [Rhodanobacter]KZC20651.1 GCN5 family acetyltransferase [Rhodanobacter denitrificans]UJJ50733.1 GNAT family N-acetyltransferase [Rhodanobacter denitrificans]UJM93447.1 GNAT family N-acetyltransferase [Rhodanobacter denitrificans]UJM96979.1 GNAT family N-acetyltransferase [Rhodanobacter denitrificans]UJN20194.1 GNAT family N-acetyltransferase [Rhodanobacter denitrificans]